MSKAGIIWIAGWIWVFTFFWGLSRYSDSQVDAHRFTACVDAFGVAAREVRTWVNVREYKFCKENSKQRYVSSDDPRLFFDK